MCEIDSEYLFVESRALTVERSVGMGINITEPHIDTYVCANANYSIRLHVRKRSSILLLS